MFTIYGALKTICSAWGSMHDADSGQKGFGSEDTFDAFLSMSQPPIASSQPTPNKLHKAESGDSEEGGFNVFIKPREGDVLSDVGGKGNHTIYLRCTFP